MNSSPLVSIIMATYNRAHFIVETLISIKNQTYSNWECLIIDDGGTDNTEAVITTILIEDPRFKFLKRTDFYKKGLPGSRNYGLDLAKGDYVVFFDDDDIIHPLCLEISVSSFDKLENTFFCFYQKGTFSGAFNYDLINTDDTYNFSATPDGFRETVIKQTIPFASCTVLWNKACFKAHRFNEHLMYAEEWECYSRILSDGFKGIIVDKVLYFNRKHANSNTAEYYNNAPIRTASKKMAVALIVSHLKEKGLLTPSVFKYLVSFAIGFRDFKMVKNILNISKFGVVATLFVYLKYRLFPIWVKYKKLTR